MSLLLLPQNICLENETKNRKNQKIKKSKIKKSRIRQTYSGNTPVLPLLPVLPHVDLCEKKALIII